MATAISNIVFCNTEEQSTCICTSLVIDNQDGLGLIDPVDNQVVYIDNGTYWDVAVYVDGAWIIRTLEGPQGDNGLPPEHEWIGTALRFRNPNGTWGAATDLKGDQGIQGLQGIPGDDGEAPEHEWVGTTLRFRNPNGSWGAFVDLKGLNGTNGTNGLNGAIGATGLAPEHEWSGTQLRFKNPNGTWGAFVDLKGATGAQGAQGAPGAIGAEGLQGLTGATGLPPEHEWDGKSIRFRNPNGSWGPWINLEAGSGFIGKYKIHIPQPEVWSTSFTPHRVYFINQAAFDAYYTPAVQLALVNPKFKLSYLPTELDFLKHNPRVWLYRYKSKKRRRGITGTPEKHRHQKGWVHPSHNNGQGEFLNSPYYGGAHADSLGQTITARKTEWTLNQSSYHSPTEIGIGVENWFGSGNNVGGITFPIAVEDWGGGINRPTGTHGNRRKSFVFKLAIVIDNPYFKELENGFVTEEELTPEELELTKKPIWHGVFSLTCKVTPKVAYIKQVDGITWKGYYIGWHIRTEGAGYNKQRT